MGESEFITSATQVVVDNRLTEQCDKENDRYKPFLSALEKHIKSIKDENDSNVVNYTFDVPQYDIPPNIAYLKKYSINLQSWIGHIIEILDDIFVAELTDLIKEDTKEIAEFEIKYVSPEDRALIEIGATFYWSIAVEMNKGQITKQSIIRFQRLKWLEEDFDNASDRANDLMNNLNFI